MTKNSLTLNTCFIYKNKKSISSTSSISLACFKNIPKGEYLFRYFQLEQHKKLLCMK